MTEEEIAERCIADIKQRMTAVDAVATGSTYRALSFESEPNHLTIFLEGRHAPAVTLQRGSGPHYNSEPKGFVEAIREWVDVRFKTADPLRKKRLTWAIVTKIRKEGTALFRSGQTRDVYSAALERAEEDFADMVATAGLSAVSESIDSVFKRYL